MATKERAGWTRHPLNEFAFSGSIRNNDDKVLWRCKHEHQGSRTPFSGELVPGVPAAATQCAAKALMNPAYRTSEEGP